MRASFYKVRQAWPIVVVGIFYLYLGFHALSGNEGFLKWANYEGKISALTSEINKKTEIKERLELHAAQLRNENLDQDRLDELARKTLNVAAEGEYVIWLDQEP